MVKFFVACFGLSQVLNSVFIITDYPNDSVFSSMMSLPPGPISAIDRIMPVHPDVRLKPLPFYDTMAEILKPSTLSEFIIVLKVLNLTIMPRLATCAFSVIGLCCPNLIWKIPGDHQCILVFEVNSFLVEYVNHALLIMMVL